MKNTQIKLYRQGDVLLTRIDKMPETAKRQKIKGKIILALGEATGHHHAIDSGNATMFRDDDAQVTYVEIKAAMAALTHQEHAPIVLEPGVYRVGLQREYHPEAIRRVND